MTQVEVQEDQLMKDLVDLWEVLVTQYVQREARERAVPKRTVRSELTVNIVVFDLLGSLPTLLAQNQIKLQNRQEESNHE